jgi:DNA (cytosine-5)-methyltransferase 1
VIIVIDLFSGAGGAARGYLDAGADVVIGVDCAPQPRYAGTYFVQADAELWFRALLRWGRVWVDGYGWLRLQDVTFVHASPPCQAWSDLQKQSKRIYNDFIKSTRELLEESRLPWIIENVEGAPLRDPVMLCGANDEHFPKLRVIRHRLFESNVPLVGASCPHRHPLVFTYDKRKAHYGKLDQDISYVQVTGGGNCRVVNKLDAMGIDWMTGAEVNEAIPPAYSEFIGRQVIDNLRQHRS